MGDGDADAGDFGGPDFAPAIPAVESSAFGAPPANRPAIVLGPGYRGQVVLTTSGTSATAQPEDEDPA
ncbi:hypothetical protein [Micromonospora sp. CP22]|uniref:hypothetical protein n=1 Tax=Micromonospora sp. CP22 TaxID=2580517 RepID=UPI0012BD350E|nr:hypothetical protein [Micromonospora sp. CP22]MTK01875.1 hypothetical protein [Micromonospora sp. CP22]